MRGVIHLTFAFALLGCSSNEIDPAFVGTFELESRDGRQLPAVLHFTRDGQDCTNEMLNATVTITRNGDWTESYRTRRQCGPGGALLNEVNERKERGLGLFASEDWWANINSRKMPLRFVSGTIVRAYEAGQDQEGVNNSVVLRLSDGTTESAGIYLNEPKDVALFKPGEYVMLVYAFDELKSGIHGLGGNQLEIALEMAVPME